MFYLIIAVGLITVILGIFTYDLFPCGSKHTIFLEGFKALLQLFFIVLIGGYIKHLFDKAEEKRNRQYEQAELKRIRINELNEFRKGLANDLVHVRTEIERIRQYYSITDKANLLSQYRQSIRKLVNLKIRLSRIWHNFKTSESSFSDAEKIQSHLENMKGYLKSVTDEYDPDNLPDYLPQKGSAVEDQLLRGPLKFMDYVYAIDDGPYTKNFLNKYRKTLSLIRKDILSGELPKLIVPSKGKEQKDDETVKKEGQNLSGEPNQDETNQPD
jgi:hypothetical protein